MTATPDTVSTRPRFADTLAVYLRPRVLMCCSSAFGRPAARAVGLDRCLDARTRRRSSHDRGLPLVVDTLTIGSCRRPSSTRSTCSSLAALQEATRLAAVLSGLLLIISIALLTLYDPGVGAPSSGECSERRVSSSPRPPPRRTSSSTHPRYRKLLLGKQRARGHGRLCRGLSAGHADLRLQRHCFWSTGLNRASASARRRPGPPAGW